MSLAATDLRPAGLGLVWALSALLLAAPGPASAGDGLVRATAYEKPAARTKPALRSGSRRGLRSGPYRVHKHHNSRRRTSSHRRYTRRHDDPKRYPRRRICRDIVILSKDGGRALAGSTCRGLRNVAVVREGKRIFLVPDRRD